MLFKSYYMASARHKYLSAAMRDSGVESWDIISRDNAITGHPSDFDVIKVKPISIWNIGKSSIVRSFPAFKKNMYIRHFYN